MTKALTITVGAFTYACTASKPCLAFYAHPVNLILQQGGDLMNDCKIPVKITGVDEAIEKAKELEAQLNKTKALAAELEEQLKGFTVVIQM